LKEGWKKSMGRIKRYTKKRKYGVTWLYTGDGIWFVNSLGDARKCGIYCGVTTRQLNNPRYLKKISVSKKYWNKYVKGGK